MVSGVEELSQASKRLAAANHIHSHSISQGQGGYVTTIQIEGEMNAVAVARVLNSLAGDDRPALRGMTLTQAQVQSLALKTMGFRDEYELRIEHDFETGDIEFDIYHVHVRIDPYGAWVAFGKESGDSLGTGGPPKFYEWDNRRLNP